MAKKLSKKSTSRTRGASAGGEVTAGKRAVAVVKVTKESVKAKVKKPATKLVNPKGKKPVNYDRVPTSKERDAQEMVRKAAEKVLGKPIPKAEEGRSVTPHAIVRARAGTGKTFTMVMGVAKLFASALLPGMLDKNGRPLTLWGKCMKELGFRTVASVPAGPRPEFEPSDQQLAIWDFMSVGEKPRTVVYLAFNNSIVEEFQTQYKWLVDCLRMVGVTLEFSTIHSLAYAACRRAYGLSGWKAVNQYKTSDLLSEVWGRDLREVWKEKAQTIKAVQELVGLCKLTLAGGSAAASWGQTGDGKPTPEVERAARALCGWDVADGELEEMALHYDIQFEDSDEVFNLVRAVLAKARQPEGKSGERVCIDYNDMIWLPVVNNLHVDQYELVIVDEGQDLNRCQQEVVLKAGGKRVLLVGDERQAIYGFAGADVGGMERMKGLLATHNGRGVEELRLTQTRRCGKAIVELARQIVDDFEAHPTNPEGQVLNMSGDEAKEQIGEKDFVLCRTNAPLVSLAFKMLRAGKRVNIQGRDIGQGFKMLIKTFQKGKGGGRGRGRSSSLGEQQGMGADSVSDFLVWLDAWEAEQAARINKRKNPDTEALVTLTDKCECLRTFCEAALSLKQVVADIDTLFRGRVCPKCGKSYDEKTKECYEKACGRARLVKPDGTLCSSIHRAKGMEADRVFIIRPELMPHKMAKTEWAKGQEQNLKYVAITRAKSTLVFVQGEVDHEE